MSEKNEILGGYTKEVSCVRCAGTRWIQIDTLEPYTCQRCRMVLAGRPTVDPLGSPAQQAARKAAGAMLRERFLQGKFTRQGKRDTQDPPGGDSSQNPKKDTPDAP